MSEFTAGSESPAGSEPAAGSDSIRVSGVEPALILATRNAHKLGELREILGPELPELDLETLVSVTDVAGATGVVLPEPVEDEVTFEGNALIKARQIAREYGVPGLADDSGLAVDVLGGAPGVFSARWSGRHGDDRANLELLLAQLADVKPEHRGAAFVCAAALVMPDGREFTTVGRMAGTLRYEPTGTNGFGYDPIFQPAGYDVTSAELEPDAKNAISHRGDAFRQMAPIIRREVLGAPA